MSTRSWARAAVATASLALTATIHVGGGLAPAGAAPVACGQQTLALASLAAEPEDVQLDLPSAVDGDEAGNIYIVDATNTAYRSDPHGNLTLAIGNDSPNPPDPLFGETTGIAVDDAGNIYVGDEGSRTVYRFDPDGNQTLAINNFSPNPPQPLFETPSGVDVDEAGNIYVADYNSETVYKFDANGNQLLAINETSPNRPTPVMITPVDVAVDPEGHIIVADFASGTVYHYDQSGNPTFVINGAISDPPFPAMTLPMSVAADRQGNVWVADWGNATTYKFDAAGKQLLYFNADSPIKAEPPSLNPSGIAWAGGVVWQADPTAGVVYEGVEDRTDLDLAITPTQSTAGTGRTKTFKVTIANAGPCDAPNVKVNVTRPDGLKLVDADAPAGTTYEDGVWTVGTLPDGGSRTLTLKVCSDCPGTYRMTATATTDSTNVGDTTASATLTVTR